MIQRPDIKRRAISAYDFDCSKPSSPTAAPNLRQHNRSEDGVLPMDRKLYKEGTGV